MMLTMWHIALPRAGTKNSVNLKAHKGNTCPARFADSSTSSRPYQRHSANTDPQTATMWPPDFTENLCLPRLCASHTTKAKAQVVDTCPHRYVVRPLFSVFCSWNFFIYFCEYFWTFLNWKIFWNSWTFCKFMNVFWIHIYVFEFHQFFELVNNFWIRVNIFFEFITCLFLYSHTFLNRKKQTRKKG